MTTFALNARWCAVVVLAGAMSCRPGAARVPAPDGGAAASNREVGSQAAPDLVLFNGRVLTVDAQDRVAEGIAVRGERIVAVGSSAQVLALAGPGTRRIDLKGRAATPGLLDAHAHFSGGGLDRIRLLDVGYPNVRSIRDVADSVRGRAIGLPNGAWVLGRGWDEGKFAEQRLPTAADLDAASPQHPVWLVNTTGHYGVANSVALRMAGVDRTTPDPSGGTIDRNADGTPTGVLKESAQGLVSRLVPDEAPGELERGIAALARAFNAEGMTGLKDPGISDATWDAYARVLARGELPVRVFVLWQGGRTLESVHDVIRRHAATSRPYESTGDDHLIAGGVKLFLDGSGGARTAWLYTDWNKGLTGVDAGNKGYPTTDSTLVRQQIRLLHDAGFHVSVHSIGDKAIDWTLDSYAQAMAANPQRGRRHGVIHANIPTDHALDVMADLQRRFDAGIPEPSAAFLWWIGDTYAGNFGPERNQRLNPFRTYQRRGIRWANGSDFDVTPFPARYGLWSAVARETLLGTHGPTPFGTAESVDVHTALRAVTIEAARQMFLETKTGSLEIGKYADIAVWDRDPYTASTASLKDMQCQLTIFNGKVVFER